MADDTKLTLFKNLFRGRQDVFPESWKKKDGGTGYSPKCSNKFDEKLCNFPCNQCSNQKFVPPSDVDIKKHLAGSHLSGVYPLLQDGTCYFIAADFDDHEGKGLKNPLKDAKAFLDVCEVNDIPAYIERSKSGDGFHGWIFFENPVPAWKARLVVFALLKEAQIIDDDTDQGSFDRLFPNQDKLSGKCLGNLIALPFYGKVIKQGNSTFLDADFNPITDIVPFMESIKTVSEDDLDRIIKEWGLSREEPKGKANYVPKDKLDPIEGLKILEDNCKFIQYCRDNQPDILEPLWYDLASNLSRFEGGRDKFHEFSWKHPNYSRKEADEKLDHAFTASGPITCAKIHQDGGGCGVTCGVESPAGLANKRTIANRKNHARSERIVSQATAEEKINEDWKEEIDQIEVHPDPVEAGSQATYFVITKLIHLDEMVVNRIVRDHLKKKFSLSANEIRTIIRSWKETKKEKRVEEKAIENASKKNEAYIKNPVFEKDGRIWKYKVKERFGEKITEEIPITTFIIKPIESITIKGEGETLKVNFEAAHKKFKEILLPPSCWNSTKNFMSILPGKETIFTGSTADVQYIRFHLSSFKMTHKTGIKTSGFHDGKFITEEGALSSNGISQDIIYFNEIPTNCRLLSIEPATPNELSEIKKYIADFNTPIVTLPILGWMTTIFFKVIVSKILDEMGLSNGFPLLNIQGEAGAGKTSTVEGVAMSTWGIFSQAKSIGELTRFTLMRMVNSSNTIPVVLEENKACMQTDKIKKVISDLVRSTYNMLEGERGRADQTTQVYRYQAPVAIVGETGFVESALLDRFVTVFLSKKDSGPYLENFRELRKQPLQKLGRSILNRALSMNTGAVKDSLEYELRSVDPELKDRPRTNTAIIRFGLDILGDILKMGFDLSIIDEAIKEGIKEGDSIHRKSAVDKILEAMCLMAEYRKKDLGYRNEIQYIYQDYLENKLDYEIVQESTINTLRIHVHGAYPKFLKWAKAYHFDGDVLPERDFKRQLVKESYCISNKPITMRIGGHLRKGFEIDINKMKEKGLLISDFWNPDDLPF